MKASEARHWLVSANLAVLLGVILFLLLAPTFGFPLARADVPRLRELTLPVFVGFLAAAARFAVGSSPAPAIAPDREQLLKRIVPGPFGVFLVGLVALLADFGYSNRAAAPIGSGMDIDTLAGWLSTLLAILSATTTFIGATLFGEARAQKEQEG